LLIDADLRQAASSRLVAPGATSGLMDIGGTVPWRDVVLADPRSGLHILPALSSSGQSSDFLSSDGMQNLLEEARQSYDYVVIDLPPLGPVMDARAVLPWTDGFILVTEWGRTPRRLVRSLIEHEPELAEDIVGVVLNKVDFRKLAQYSDPGGAERYMGSYSRYYQVDATEKV
jgi:succinoglycan biosynthesis transport protein ExoP